MNLPKGETRQELLNRAFLYILFISISVLIFIRVKSLIFDLFVAVVLSALAEPVVYRLSKKLSRKLSALITVGVILIIIGATFFSIIPIMVQEIYFLSSQLPTYFEYGFSFFLLLLFLVLLLPKRNYKLASKVK